jgi:hypothetical protein
MESVYITINVVSSNPARAMCTRYNIMWQSLPVSCDMSVGFSTNKTERYNWYIGENAVKHHNPIIKRRMSQSAV